jgi:hypothetical protein
MRLSRVGTAFLISVAGVALPACALHDGVAPVSEVRVVKEKGLARPRPENGANQASSETSVENMPCTEASWACIVASLHPAGTDWVFFGDSYLKAQPGTAQSISMAGLGRAWRGYLSPVSEQTILACTRINSRSCPDVQYLSNTCASTTNSVTLTTRHVIKIPDYMPSVSNLNVNDHCDGPTPDQCNAGGGDDGDHQYETSKGSTKRASFSCDGGGSDPSKLYCDIEWIRIEISYDGGATWEVWWEGYADVCDLFEE